MSPKREDVDTWLKRNKPICDYCIYSTEDIPDKDQEGLGRLWCKKRQIIVMEIDKAYSDYEY